MNKLVVAPTGGFFTRPQLAATEHDRAGGPRADRVICAAFNRAANLSRSRWSEATKAAGSHLAGEAVAIRILSERIASRTGCHPQSIQCVGLNHR